MRFHEREEQREAGRPLDTPREEAALPVHAQFATPDARDERSKGLSVLGVALLLVMISSVALEYGGWRILADASASHDGGIDWLAFLRGAADTAMGAIGIGAIGGLATLVFPSTWKRPWRRVAVGFLGGSAGFLGFLSWLTLTYFL